MAAPALIMQFSRGDEKVIAVIDESGLIAPKLESDEEIRFETTELPTEEARRELAEKFGVLWIGGDILENSNNVRLYANSSSSLALESNITGQIERILETEKLKAYNIENLSQILEQVETKVVMQTFRNDKSQEEDTQAQSSAVATGLGYVLGFILYMFLLIYGSMVMQSVIEEKNNRVLEVMVSSVRPFDLMMGKILGVASVAIVQVLIWGVLIAGVGALVMPHLMPEDVMASAQAMQQGMPDAASMTDMNPEMLQAVAAMTDLGYIIKIFASLLLFVFGGYLLYSAMFAAVGSAVDNVQDASQLQMPITLPIILALLMMFVVIRDPNSQMAFWFSIIPFTSPIVMMARIPYDIPLWEIVLSLVLLYGSFVGMVWVASKIYRVGIFMYGKKPSLKELFEMDSVQVFEFFSVSEITDLLKIFINLSRIQDLPGNHFNKILKNQTAMISIDNYDFKGKRAIIRVDFNVPLDEKGEVTDDTRIRAAHAHASKRCSPRGGSVILMSHMGRPKKNPDPKYSLEQIVPAVEKNLGVKVEFAGDCIGEKAAEMAKALKPGRGHAAGKPAFLRRGGGQAPRSGRRRHQGGEGRRQEGPERGSAERVRPEARFVRRLLHQRRIRHGAPQARLDRPDRREVPQRQDVRLPDGEGGEGHRPR